MVEFAIENAQALKKRALRQTRVHEPSPRRDARRIDATRHGQDAGR